jgi:hypothetical protein
MPLDQGDNMSHIEIPIWAQVLLRDQHCPFCKRPYTEADVCASGNRRKNGRVTYFYEVECPQCGNPAMSLTSRPCDSCQLGLYLMEIVAEKIRSQKETPEEQPPPSKEKSARNDNKITDAEILMAHEIIHTSGNHIEFLKKIGLTEKVINRYAKPRK